MNELLALNFALNPTLDIAKFNTLIASMKAGFDNLKPIDATILTSSLNKVKPVIVGLVQGTDGLASGISKAVSETTRLGSAGSLASKAFNFSNMMNSVNIISNAFGTVAQAGIEFESNLAAVSAITGFTGANLDALGVSARSLAKEFGGSANEQLKSFQGILSKLGPQMAEDAGALELIAKNVNTLSAASGDDAATSMNAITDAMLQMGLASGTPMEQAQNSTKVINALAAGAQVGAAEIPQVAQSLLAAGVAAKGANMSLVDVNAAIQVLAVGGKTGAEAGTALRNVLGLMQKASGPSEAAMKKLGTSSKELGDILTTQGLDAALAKLNVGMDKVGSSAEKNTLMMDMFGAENAAAAGIMMQNTDKFAEFSKGIEEGMQGQGSAFQQAAIRMNTAEKIISKIQAGISDAFIGISQSVGQGITAMVGASTQIAPLMMSFSGISQILPEGAFTNSIQSIKSLGTTILSQLVPGLISQDIATKSVIFNTEALTFANIRQSLAVKSKIVLDYLQSTAIWQVATGQMALNAAFLANPVGLVIAGTVALVGVLYLLYENVDSVRQVFDNAWSIIKFGASETWGVIKSFGSVLYEIGSLIVSGWVLPFKIVWGVISTIGEKIAGLFGVTQGFGTDLSSIFMGIQSLANGVIGVFDQVKAVIAGVGGFIGSMTESISTGIGQLLTLDFGGLYDTVTGAGDKAGKEFNSAFNAKMRTAKFDEAKRNIQTGLEIGEGISVKVKAQTDFKDTVKAYEDAQNEMNALATKKTSGGLTEAESKKFDNLKTKANQYATDIQKIAPEAVKGFSAIVGANGVITNSYDININKAKEFAKANDYSDSLNKQKDAVSKNVSQMAGTYSQQTNEVQRLQKELAKPVTDEKAYIKLRESFTSATKQAEEMKTQLVDNFYQAGQAGMLTDSAIQGVAKGLKITNAQAKDMLLTKELKGAGESGVLTAKQTDILAKKYNVSKEQVKAIFDKQKQITAETLKTTQATEDWSGALDRVKKDQAKALDAVKNAQLQYKKGQISKEDLDLITKASEEKIKAGNAEVKTFNDVNKAIASNKNLRIDEVKDTKDAAKESAKANKEAKTKYEIAKDEAEANAKAFKEDEESLVLKEQKRRVELGIATSAKQALLDKIEANKREVEFNSKQLTIYGKLKDEASKLSDKDGKRSKELADIDNKLKDISNSSSKLNTETLSITAQINLDDKKLKDEVEALSSAGKRLEIEANVKLGTVDASELSKYDLGALYINKEKVLNEIKEIQDKITTNSTDSKDTKELEKQLAEQQNLIWKANYDISEQQRKIVDEQNKERINQISDAYERERELKNYELQKAYADEIKLARNNQSQILVAQMKYNDLRIKSDQDYLSKTSIGYNAITKVALAFQNIKPNSIDNSKVADVNKTKNAIAKERTELQKSYDEGKTDYEAYQTKLTEIQQKESDNKIALEEAESEKRKAIWRGFTTAVSGYFGTMYDEYSKKSAESFANVTALHSNSATLQAQIYQKEQNIKLAQLQDDALGLQIYTQQKTELLKQVTASTDAETKAQGEAYLNLGISAGVMFGQLITDNDSFGKAFLKTALSTLKALVPVISAQILGYSLATPDSIATLGVTGLLKFAALNAILYGAVGLAESAVSGAFKNGVIDYQGKGTGTSDSNIVRISAGESVMTAEETKKFKPLFTHIRNRGDLVSYVETDIDLQRKLVEKQAIDYYTDFEKQKIHLNDLLIERREQANQSNALENKLNVLIDETRRTQLILQNKALVETKHAYNINATNNVIKQVEKADLWRQ